MRSGVLNILKGFAFFIIGFISPVLGVRRVLLAGLAVLSSGSTQELVCGTQPICSSSLCVDVTQPEKPEVISSPSNFSSVKIKPTESTASIETSTGGISPSGVEGSSTTSETPKSLDNPKDYVEEKEAKKDQGSGTSAMGAGITGTAILARGLLNIKEYITSHMASKTSEPTSPESVEENKSITNSVEVDGGADEPKGSGTSGAKKSPLSRAASLVLHWVSIASRAASSMVKNKNEKPDSSQPAGGTEGSKSTNQKPGKIDRALDIFERFLSVAEKLSEAEGPDPKTVGRVLDIFENITDAVENADLKEISNKVVAGPMKIVDHISEKIDEKFDEEKVNGFINKIMSTISNKIENMPSKIMESFVNFGKGFGFGLISFPVAFFFEKFEALFEVFVKTVF